MYIDTATSILPLVPTLPQTTTDSNYASNLSLLQSHITRAESFINSKIANRYDLSGYTATTAPPILKMLTQDISSYYILRSYYSSDNQNISEWVESFKEAIEVLDAIRNGDMDIVDTNGSLISQSTTVGAVESNTMDFDPTFTEDDSLNFAVDKDKF